MDNTIGPARRIIPCLDVRHGQVVKGVQFKDHRVVGDILDLACSYRDQGADELVFYDISASPEGRSVDTEWVSRVASVLDIPFCVAGGIRSVAQGRAVLNAGADKLSINSPALERPDLINELVRDFGSQCVVVGIDSIQEDEQWMVKQYTGDVSLSRSAGKSTLDWVQEVEQRGAGEIVLNCMASDGVRNGYDITQLQAVRKQSGLPLIASGGAGSTAHFEQVFMPLDQGGADVDGALAASVFHSGQIAIPDLKQQLINANIKVRP